MLKESNYQSGRERKTQQTFQTNKNRRDWPATKGYNKIIPGRKSLEMQEDMKKKENRK